MIGSRAFRTVRIATLVAVLAATGIGRINPDPASAAGSGATFADYAQCANGAPPNTSTACPSGWVNGILQGSNSHYAEDQVTPQRAQVLVPAGSPATNRTMTFRYQTRKGTTHAYDSLATWNATQQTADRCQGLSAANCVGGEPSTFPIPDDPTAVGPVGSGVSPVTSAHMLPAGPNRLMTMYGGTITGVSVPVHSNAAGTGDDYATVTITYSVVNTAKARAVQLLFGGHLAAGLGSRGWGAGLGASSISGGPYHIKWDAADGASIGNRDNQIMGAAILLPPNLVVTKTADRETVSSTEDVGFTITVTNTGGTTATNVTLSDPLPVAPGLSWSISPPYAGPGTCAITDGTLTCAFGSLAPGASVAVHVSSPTSSETTGTIFNTATAQADEVPPSTGTATVTVNPPNLVVTKTPDASTVNTTEPIGFTITVTNTGAGTAFDVTLSDPLPANDGLAWSIDPAYTGPGTCAIAAGRLTCSFGDLAPGADATVHLSSPTTDATAGEVRNTAVARATNNPPTEGTGVTTVNPPGLFVDKAADDASVSSGESIGFTVTVRNDGPGTALDVTLSDPLPAAEGLAWTIDPADDACAITGGTLTCSFGDLVAGQSVSVHVTSPTTGATFGTLTNTATARARNHDPVDATAIIEVLRPSLAIAKTPDAEEIDTPAPIGFTITVSNGGPGTAFDVTLSDPLPANDGLVWTIDPAYTGPGTCAIESGSLSCSFGDLAPGASASVHITSPTTVTTSGVISNTATARASNHPPVDATAVIRVLRPALTLLKAACAEAAVPGAQFGYTLTYGNSGPATAYGAVLTDTIPQGTTVTDSGGGVVSADGRSVTWELGDLPAGATGSKTLTVDVPTTAAGPLVNSASLAATNAAPVTSVTDTLVSSGSAAASGRAYGVSASLLDKTLEQPPTPDTDVENPDQLQTIAAGGVKVDLLSVAKSAGVANGLSEASAIATTAAVSVNAGGVSVNASALVARSVSSANASSATSSSGGSRVANLVINGTSYGDVTSPKTITVTNPVGGAVLGTVRVLEHVRTGAAAGAAQPGAGGYTSGLTVNALRISVADLPTPVVNETSEVVVASAASAASFPTAPCGDAVDRIAGNAVLVDTPGLVPVGRVTVGEVVLPSTGGAVVANVADTSAVGVVTGRTTSNGSLTPRHVDSSAVAHSLSLLSGAVTATTVQATATSDGGTSVTGTTVIERLVVGGVDVCQTLGLQERCQPPANTVIAIATLGTLVLNEQVPTGTGDLRTTAVHLYLATGGELIVSSAYADTNT